MRSISDLMCCSCLHPVEAHQPSRVPQSGPKVSSCTCRGVALRPCLELAANLSKARQAPRVGWGRCASWIEGRGATQQAIPPAPTAGNAQAMHRRRPISCAHLWSRRLLVSRCRLTYIGHFRRSRPGPVSGTGLYARKVTAVPTWRAARGPDAACSSTPVLTN
jgi:hypothetical protein